MCRVRKKVFNQISIVGFSGGENGGGWRCSRLRRAMTAPTHAVHVGKSSTTGINSTTKVGSSSQ